MSAVTEPIHHPIARRLWAALERREQGYGFAAPALVLAEHQALEIGSGEELYQLMGELVRLDGFFNGRGANQAANRQLGELLQVVAAHLERVAKSELASAERHRLHVEKAKARLVSTGAPARVSALAPRRQMGAQLRRL